MPNNDQNLKKHIDEGIFSKIKKAMIMLWQNPT